MFSSDDFSVGDFGSGSRSTRTQANIQAVGDRLYDEKFYKAVLPVSEGKRDTHTYPHSTD